MKYRAKRFVCVCVKHKLDSSERVDQYWRPNDFFPDGMNETVIERN